MASPAPNQTTITPRNDALAVFGLLARPVTLPLYDGLTIVEAKRIYDALTDRAAEKGWSLPYALGLYTVCHDIIRGQTDDAFVVRLAPLIGLERSASSPEVVNRAGMLLTWLTADRISLAKVGGGNHGR